MIDRIRPIFRSFFPEKKISYAQSGEDLIVKCIFESLRTLKPSYLDIGAHDPKLLSNTFLFYKLGAHGVCVEPDPTIFSKLKRARPRDVCLNVGVGTDPAETADFYVMTARTLNTFSKEVAERYQSYGTFKIERVIPIPILSVNEIIRRYCKTPPQLISIDVEGLELPILRSLDFENMRPAVLCIETLTYTEDKTEHKLEDTIDFVRGQGYFLYADTYINSIFVDESIWQARR
jgi:FkbM family methyltransferase